MHWDDRSVVLLRQADRSGLPGPFHQALEAWPRQASRGEQDDDLLPAKSRRRRAQRLALPGESALLLDPLHRDDHVLHSGRDPERVPIGEEHDVLPHPLQRVVDGDAIGDAGRMIRHDDHGAPVGDLLQAVHGDIQGEQIAHVFEHLGTGHRSDGVGHRHGLVVAERALQRPHDQAPDQRMTHQPRSALLDQRVDNMRHVASIGRSIPSCR